MIKLKGMDLPKDLSILIKTPLIAIRWKNRISKMGFNNILAITKSIDSGFTPNHSQIDSLKKLHRSLAAYLTKVKKDTNPCQTISMALFEQCRKLKINAKLVVGINKDISPTKGHSWVEINGSAINEDNESLKIYTRMMEI